MKSTKSTNKVPTANFYAFTLLFISSLIFGACSEIDESDEKEEPTIETHTNFGLKYDIPADWRIKTESEHGAQSVTYYGNHSKDDVHGFITLRCKELSDSAYIEKQDGYVDGFTDAYKSSYDAVQTSMIKIDGAEALSVSFESEHDGNKIMRKIVIMYTDSKEYFLEFNCYSADYKKGNVVYEAMVKSMKFKG